MIKKLKILLFGFFCFALCISYCQAVNFRMNVETDPEKQIVSKIEKTSQYFYSCSIEKDGKKGIAALGEFHEDLKPFTKPPTLTWQYSDAMGEFSLPKEFNHRLYKWLTKGIDVCVSRARGPDAIIMDKDKLSCMEFSFFVGLDVHQGAGDDTADLKLADVDPDKFDETLRLGDLMLVMVSNPISRESVAGHSLIYAGNDHFISPMLDGEIYFQNIDQVKNIWEYEPGEGVLGVKFAFKKVVDATIITEKSTGLRRLFGRELKPLDEEEAPKKSQKKRKSGAKN